MHRSRFLPTVVVVTLLGVLLSIVSAGASGRHSRPMRFQAETMAERTVGGPDGPAWNLWSNGRVSDEVMVASGGRARFVIRARARSTLGTAPILELSVDGVVIGNAAVAPNQPGGAFRDYVVEADLTAGRRMFSVAFVNDANRPSNDMDLIIDWVEIIVDGDPPINPTTSEDVSSTTVGDRPITVTTEETTTVTTSTTTEHPPTTPVETPSTTEPMRVTTTGGSTTTTGDESSTSTTEPSTSTTEVPTSTTTTTTTTTGPDPDDEQENLALLRRSSVRNTNHDQSAFRDTPQTQLDIQNHLGPRRDYLGKPGGNPEEHFPTSNGGNFRVSCEFSHFAYDDPIVFPDQPGRAHLHMFFGNTDASAYSTFESLRDSGSGTCNGQELNRTAYWAPAMFDGAGNVRIPDRINVYYKGYGMTRGRAQTYPEGAAMLASQKVHEVPAVDGGSPGQVGYQCTNQYRGNRSPSGDSIPRCVGTAAGAIRSLEMIVKFPQCWNGEDPTDPDNFHLPQDGSGYGWFRSDCGDGVNLPNLEYLISYRLDAGETTDGWYLASDIDMATGRLRGAPGASSHADWLGAWHPEINRMFIDNCVNYRDSAPSGCGHGYLTNAGPDNRRPYPGPALRFRPQYRGPNKVAAATLFDELCPTGRALGRPEHASHCRMASR